MAEITRHPDDYAWEQHVPYGRERVIETSCCGAYEWVSAGGQYLVLRNAKEGGHEEAGRGVYVDARRVWHELVLAHRAKHGRPRLRDR
jgi:hypothetical protein